MGGRQIALERDQRRAHPCACERLHDAVAYARRGVARREHEGQRAKIRERHRIARRQRMVPRDDHAIQRLEPQRLGLQLRRHRRFRAHTEIRAAIGDRGRRPRLLDVLDDDRDVGRLGAQRFLHVRRKASGDGAACRREQHTTAPSLRGGFEAVERRGDLVQQLAAALGECRARRRECDALRVACQ